MNNGNGLNVPHIRYALLRNLRYCTSAICGTFIQIDGFYSEVSWSREAIFLISEDAFPRSSFTLRVFSVERPNQLLSEGDLVQNCLSSTLSYPWHTHNSHDFAFRNSRLLFEVSSINAIFPLDISLHDLPRLTFPSSPHPVLLFANELGKLFATENDKDYFKDYGLSLLPIPLLAESQLLTLFEAKLSPHNFRQMLDFASQLFELSEQYQALSFSIQTELDSFVVTIPVLNCFDHKTSQVSQQISLLEKEINSLEAVNHVASRKTSSKIPPGMDSSCFFPSSSILVNARRLELLGDTLRIFELSVDSTFIRGVDLLDTREEERAIGFGHLAHLVSYISFLFQVPLRFVPASFGSHSFLLDPLYFPKPVTASLSRILGVFVLSANVGGIFPLFPQQGQLKWKFESGVQLLFVAVYQVVESLEKLFGTVLNRPMGKQNTIQSFHQLTHFLFKLGVLKVL